MAELVDALGLGPSSESCAGSSPVTRTNNLNVRLNRGEKMKRFFWYCLLFLITIVSFLIYFFSDKNPTQSYYKSININGKTMRAEVGGSGNKTIVMLSGWGTDSPIDDFYPLYKRLIKDYKVVVIEYFGYFGSDLTEEERTNKNMVEEIRTALKELNIEPPYILMPHSMSGLYSLYYAGKYPSEVSGIIGIDMSLAQKQLERWNEESFEETKKEVYNKKLNISVLNQWNAFYSNSKELENIKYPIDLPVLAFLSTEQIENVDNMITSGQMKTSWVDINKNMITNPNIQNIEILEGYHNNLAYNQTNRILELSKKFIENL